MSNRIVNHLMNSTKDRKNELNNNTFIHYSGIYRNGKIVQLGSNNLRNTYNGHCVCFSTHAEMDVLQKVLKGQARTTI